MHDHLTQTDREAELDRQMLMLAKGSSPILVCPWCGVINDRRMGGEDTCCESLDDALLRRGERNMKSIEGQYNGIINGLRSAIDCPYCGLANRPLAAASHPSDWVRQNVSPYCCDLFAMAMSALAFKVSQQFLQDKFHRTQDAIAKGNRN